MTERIITVDGGRSLSLPEVFSEMANGRLGSFDRLRPHQRPAWHMFLCQVGALACRRSKLADPPTDPAAWTAILRKMTPKRHMDDPWSLVVLDPHTPAFMQPPVPEEANLKWRAVESADAMDLLIHSKNHSVQRHLAWSALPEDWMYSLVSLQTSDGYSGSGLYGIARMNGGSSSRAMLGLAPAGPSGTAVDHAAWWRRDMSLLLKMKRQKGESWRENGPALLWMEPWNEGEPLQVEGLNRLFVEVCRRVRLELDPSGRITAKRSSSKGPRIDAAKRKGNLGDPWAPVHKDGKALTLSTGKFHFKRLAELLFSNDWTSPLAARPASWEVSEDMLLVAEALSRGNCRTDGLQSRILRLPAVAVSALRSGKAAPAAKSLLEVIDLTRQALGFGFAVFAANGDFEKVGKRHRQRARPFQEEFDRLCDRLFFPHLWNHLQEGAMFSLAHSTEVLDVKAFMILDEACRTAPCQSLLRDRARLRAKRAFWGMLRNERGTANNG